MTGSQVRTVLVVHPSAQLYGADRMAAESVAGLVAAGWRCTVVLPGDGPLVPVLEAAGASVLLVDSPVLRKAYVSPTGLVRFGAELLGSVPRVVGAVRGCRADVVYVNTVTVPQWLAVARALGRGTLCHVHEAEDSVPRPLRLALAAPLLLARTVVTNSRASRDVLLADLPRLRARTEVVYNGFDGPEHPVPPRESLDAPVRLVLVGRLSPRKGTDVAVAALDQLVRAGTDAVLDLVGGVFPGYEWFEEQVRRQVLETGLGDRVRFVGETDEPWTSMAAADVVLVPSRVEPFGNTAVEALLAERPVVASATQGLVEIVEPGRTGELVVPDDPAALAAAVQHVVDDWPEVRRRSAAVVAEARELFSSARYRREIAAAVAAAAVRGSRLRRRRLPPAQAGW